ncbi:hypothetical protein J2Y48_002637 [Mycoplana sp. BE70]|uniref:hypothetical protein n=1 Tax=Mycoplana sp. BE70 TaxID=2817775 RepID=UPI00285840FD|nr:hypothetical protein [Mycoplana sp. BE70]MDR6757341.1 hypothetical protein [Mycoplana sp. BE70]
MRMMAKLALMVLAVGLAAFLLVTLAQVSTSAGDVLYGKPLRLDPDDGLAILVIAIILTPGALTAWLAETLAGGRLKASTRALLIIACNGIVGGLLLGLFASLDDYFTAPGWEPAYAIIGAIAGAACGALQSSLTARIAGRG